MCLGCDLWKSEFLTCFSFYVFVFVYIFFFINSDAYVFLDLRFRLFWAGWTVSFALCCSSWWFCRYGWQMIMICNQNLWQFMTLILFTRASWKRLGTLQYSQCVSKRSQLKSYTYHMLIICFFLTDSRIQALTTSPPDQSRPGRCKYFWQQLLLLCIFFSF